MARRRGMVKRSSRGFDVPSDHRRQVKAKPSQTRIQLVEVRLPECRSLRVNCRHIGLWPAAGPRRRQGDRATISRSQREFARADRLQQRSMAFIGPVVAASRMPSLRARSFGLSVRHESEHRKQAMEGLKDIGQGITLQQTEPDVKPSNLYTGRSPNRNSS